MSAVITALTAAETGLTEAKLFAVVAELVPFLVMIIPVALGTYFLRKLIKGSSTAKVRMQFNELVKLIHLLINFTNRTRSASTKKSEDTNKVYYDTLLVTEDGRLEEIWKILKLISFQISECMIFL